MAATADRLCAGYFERKGKGMMYVYARWSCKRPALKGFWYCSYCEPFSDKQKRLAAKAALQQSRAKGEG